MALMSSFDCRTCRLTVVGRGHVRGLTRRQLWRRRVRKSPRTMRVSDAVAQHAVATWSCSNACTAQVGGTSFRGWPVPPGTRFGSVRGELLLQQCERFNLRRFCTAEVFAAAPHPAAVVPTRHHNPSHADDLNDGRKRFYDQGSLGSDNQSPSGYDESLTEFGDVIEFARASFKR